MNQSTFETLYQINVNDHTEQKNGLTYLSWVWAWAEFKKLFPKSYYTIYENDKGWNYFTDGNTCWVKTGVTIVDDFTDPSKPYSEELIEYLPVMDFKNKSIPLSAVSSMDVNKAIQRSLTKAVARHGLGLYIYAGEDLPEQDQEAAKSAKDLIAKIRAVSAQKTAGCTPAQKKDFITQHFVPVLGTADIMSVTDTSLLSKLLETLNNL